MNILGSPGMGIELKYGWNYQLLQEGFSVEQDY